MRSVRFGNHLAHIMTCIIHKQCPWLGFRRYAAAIEWRSKCAHKSAEHTNHVPRTECAPSWMQSPHFATFVRCLSKSTHWPFVSHRAIRTFWKSPQPHKTIRIRATEIYVFNTFVLAGRSRLPSLYVPLRIAILSASSASFADRKRRARCWFIFALCNCNSQLVINIYTERYIYLAMGKM